jgi:hypothetical protein
MEIIESQKTWKTWVLPKEEVVSMEYMKET